MFMTYYFCYEVSYDRLVIYSVGLTASDAFIVIYSVG